MVALGSDEKIYVIGGSNDFNAVLDSVAVVDPATGIVTVGPSLPVALSHAALASSADGDFFWLIGGSTNADPSGAVDTVYRFSVDKQQWTLLDESLPTPLCSAAAAYIDGTVYVAGGEDATGNASSEVLSAYLVSLFEDDFESGNLDNWSSHVP